ncbi:DUF6497 family protein [Pseudodonghicola xiamenensis]|uniref:Acetolactate synthase n=1 Tax=Pseudodonghicola xiamenensis TaxID=337702 RepID=A0A8J3H8D2_9RHOB|nr:DUF6497 family protein [Pseudodonghicola xiamenensis]GHG99864.1 hypothetical protein GCM10010961_36020 [Pseudodonghicola xiamenensis]
MFAVASLAAAAPAAVQVAVPSGRQIALQEVLLDDTPGALWARFRFLAPDLAAAPARAGEDLDVLCREVALPYLSSHDLSPARVVVSLADRAVPFGESDPEATQVFEAYRLEKTGCVWEGF